MRITLSNSYHGTSVNLNAEYLGQQSGHGRWRLTAGQVKRSKSVLCGVSGCTCSDDLGLRPEDRREQLAWCDVLIQMDGGLQLVGR